MAYFAKTQSVAARDVGIPAAIEQTAPQSLGEDLLLPTLEQVERAESEMPELDRPSESIVPEDQ
ncbi:hypothetical protein N8993_06490 [Pseudomonadales bacterium]|nr:hypothetical protein [Pseudomonadales bacterium]